jgi:hypothetical protein
MKKYLATATVTMLYEFDESEIEEQFNPLTWAEDAYVCGSFILDGHEIEIKEQ